MVIGCTNICQIVLGGPMAIHQSTVLCFTLSYCRQGFYRSKQLGSDSISMLWLPYDQRSKVQLTWHVVAKQFLQIVQVFLVPSVPQIIPIWEPGLGMLPMYLELLVGVLGTQKVHFRVMMLNILVFLRDDTLANDLSWTEGPSTRWRINSLT